ncbi:MAG: hypothetical protein HFG51_01940 [Lachnospiraceae bacterium]|nr:hypothetical protein [Lachnospiraceae bacterium]
MKKYRYCFFLCLSLAVLLLGMLIWWFSGRKDDNEMPLPEEIFTRATESETVAEDRIVLNQELVLPANETEIERKGRGEEREKQERKEYLLVSEDGFLLVFGNNAREICLYTHIPITDFPEEEREKLREGIWFSRMEEIYSYLESYTS